MNETIICSFSSMILNIFDYILKYDKARAQYLYSREAAACILSLTPQTQEFHNQKRYGVFGPDL